MPPDGAKRVFVRGFDPRKQNLRQIFSSYGSIASLDLKREPRTGVELPFCLITYKDPPLKGSLPSATQAAKVAELNGNADYTAGTIKVKRDRDGKICQAHVDEYLRRQESKRANPPTKPSSLPQGPRPIDTSGAPVNAPRGPSARNSARSIASPRTLTTPVTRPRRASVLPGQSPAPLPEPYVYLSFDHPRPRISRTDLLNLFRNTHYIDIVPGNDGWYIGFSQSYAMGQCYEKYAGRYLFSSKSKMQCFPDIASRPQHTRPTERATDTSPKKRADKPKPQETERKEDEMDILQREQAEDNEHENKLRADGYDIVVASNERLMSEVFEVSFDRIKSKTIMPTFADCLDPDRHRDKRQKLGFSDDTMQTEPLVGGPPVAIPTGPKSLRLNQPDIARNALRPQAHNARRVNAKRSTDAFDDSRRQIKPPRRTGFGRLEDQVRPQDDSASDEEQTPLTTRDHEDTESRPLSSTSRTTTPMDEDVFDVPMLKEIETPPALTASEPPKTKTVEENIEATPAPEQQPPSKKRINPNSLKVLRRQLFGDRATKSAESMAIQELEQTITQAGYNEAFADDRIRCQLELEKRRALAQDDAVFRPASATPDVPPPVASDAMDLDTQPVKPTKKRAPPKKKKTKKELAAERAAARRKTETEADTQMDDAPDLAAESDAAEPKEEEPEEVRKSTLPWAQSSQAPARTFGDEQTLPPDLDWWQHAIKDNEDYQFLAKSVAEEHAAAIRDAKYWTWNQKHIKSLNVPVTQDDALKVTAEIPGYYVANASGCARTEGIKKILNSEKSKYLPHRIKVQKAREEREALAASGDSPQIETPKPAETFESTSSSRSNRANNRRLVNDINLQKQNAPAFGVDTDAFRFNQLKKRKKHVRFDRSAIHGWGLYTEEGITAGDLIIEYVGEKLRQKVADMREIRYDRQGIGSSYLFRMAEDEIIDATKKGGIARFINHSCVPNCTAKIIRVEGTRRIVIYALKDINRGECLESTTNGKLT